LPKVKKKGKKYKLEDIGLDLRLPVRYRWDEYKANGDTILHYSTLDKYIECENRKSDVLKEIILKNN